MKKSVSLLIFGIILGIGGFMLYQNTVQEKSVPVIAQHEQSKNKVITIKDTNEFYEITASYPTDVRDKEKVIESFVTSIVKERQEAWKIGGDVWKAEKQVEKDFPDRPKMVYQLVIDYKQHESKAKGTVSYVFTMYEFTGGAHGMTNLATFTFNNIGRITINEVLTLATNNNDIALTSILEQKLISVLGDGADTKMIHDGLGLSCLPPNGMPFDKVACPYDDFSFRSNFQHFIIKDEGITFLMGQYQVAPYAAGMPQVTLTWEELGKFVKR